MKKLIENFIIIMVLTIAILFSYALIEKKISGRSSSEFINFLFSTQEKASSNKSSVTSNKGNSKKGNNSSTQSADTMNYRTGPPFWRCSLCIRLFSVGSLHFRNTREKSWI